jgi:hypothetical protein
MADLDLEKAQIQKDLADLKRRVAAFGTANFGDEVADLERRFAAFDEGGAAPRDARRCEPRSAESCDFIQKMMTMMTFICTWTTIERVRTWVQPRLQMMRECGNVHGVVETTACDHSRPCFRE